ncbi:hypothetical protein AMTR_s00015p00220650 [Amborella trichopoda]|uniref:Uncharacterized protein n=1 Tax=Amborella trichopoda TaxID=13333 RepID=W1PFX7_AMBTC|nr:hypothetical protein AMTR_s00015p00220650 [Amborella trichopoda]
MQVRKLQVVGKRGDGSISPLVLVMKAVRVTVKNGATSCLVVGCDGLEAHNCGVALQQKSWPGGLGNGGRAQQRHEGSGGSNIEECELQRMGDDNREVAGWKRRMGREDVEG